MTSLKNLPKYLPEVKCPECDKLLKDHTSGQWLHCLKENTKGMK